MAKLKPSTIPKETILSVRSGSVAWRGHATSIRIAGEEVIILARTIPQLNIVFNYLHPKDTMQARSCHPMVMVPLVETKLDDEL